MTKAIIAGGGIGGLTAAIALWRAGVEVAVFERVPEIEEIGAGITLWANATRPPRRLGATTRSGPRARLRSAASSAHGVAR